MFAPAVLSCLLAFCCLYASAIDIPSEVLTFSAVFSRKVYKHNYLPFFDFKSLTAKEQAKAIENSVRTVNGELGLKSIESTQKEVYQSTLITADDLYPSSWVQVFASGVAKGLSRAKVLRKENAEDLAVKYFKFLNKLIKSTSGTGKPETKLYVITKAFLGFLFSQGVLKQDTIPITGKVYGTELYLQAGRSYPKWGK